jgi:hypothetical protein
VTSSSLLVGFFFFFFEKKKRKRKNVRQCLEFDLIQEKIEALTSNTKATMVDTATVELACVQIRAIFEASQGAPLDTSCVQEEKTQTIQKVDMDLAL